MTLIDVAAVAAWPALAMGVWWWAMALDPDGRRAARDGLLTALASGIIAAQVASVVRYGHLDWHLISGLFGSPIAR